MNGKKLCLDDHGLGAQLFTCELTETNYYEQVPSIRMIFPLLSASMLTQVSLAFAVTLLLSLALFLTLALTMAVSPTVTFRVRVTT